MHSAFTKIYVLTVLLPERSAHGARRAGAREACVAQQALLLSLQRHFPRRHRVLLVLNLGQTDHESEKIGM